MERRSQLAGLQSFKRQVLAFQLGNCCFLFDKVQVLCIQRSFGHHVGLITEAEDKEK